jgi:hypothetical protein
VETEVLNKLSGAGINIEPVREAVRARARAVSLSVSEDELIKRLEAIEARLAAIERVLREQRGETEVS